MKVTLTYKQKYELENQHDKTRDGQERDRIKAVLLASEGWSTAMISQALRIHETTVLRHLHDCAQSEKLKPENGGSSSRLSALQTMALIEHLTEVTYHHTHQIIAYVLAQFGVCYIVSGMNKWLHHHGFSYKKPKSVPHKALKSSCGKEETILFMDAVHPTQATKLSHGWIRTGQDKAIETTGSRSRLNIVGALNLSEIGRTVIDNYESINSENIVRFLCKLRESYPLTHKLHLILDSAGYHRSDLVRDAAFVLNIELHYLPPNSPNLNPIERLWKVMNEQVRNNVYFKNKRNFDAAIGRFFTVILPEIAGSLASRINDNFQVLNPASSS
ncbi:IS630 family transposase [Photobacterium damselae subsp. damselae]|uniref:IS630 family transposase n=1 Tax=Photobacterium damselae TaxID=38293 RepID=UPI000A2FF2E9|nr:IS630 family transposase [Photobacterium damselae]ARR48781.1 IS630 family transposase [Photobacterium damselae subsp. damselae]QAY34184.1 IS630 family transposase [Photobacterium damselae subsp. damselae]